MQYCVNSCNLFYRKTQEIKMCEDYLNMTIGNVLKKLEQSVPDTEHSKRIFDVEEGEQDKYFQSINTSNLGRRDWIILWEIYGRKSENSTESPNQKFHLKNYLEFKLQNDLHLPDNFYVFCYRYIRNSALIMVDCKKLTQYLINENAYVDSTSFKDLEHVRIKADRKYHGILKNTDHQM